MIGLWIIIALSCDRWFVPRPQGNPLQIVHKQDVDCLAKGLNRQALVVSDARVALGSGEVVDTVYDWVVS